MMTSKSQLAEALHLFNSKKFEAANLVLCS